MTELRTAEQVPKHDPLGSATGSELAYESGVEVKARSQWAYARMRFFRHRLAVVSLIVLAILAFVAIFAKRIAPYGYDELDFSHIAQGPGLKGGHIFGTDLLGRDYLSRIIYGLQTSLWVAFFVAALVDGDRDRFRGRRRLLRRPDRQPAHALHRSHPDVARACRPARRRGVPRSERLAPRADSDLATHQGRTHPRVPLLDQASPAIIRGIFLSLREKEFVEAARAAGASDRRIIFRHILPNCVGPIAVTMTLIVAHRDPHRGSPLVPRLRHPAAPPGARKPHRRR